MCNNMSIVSQENYLVLKKCGFFQFSEGSSSDESNDAVDNDRAYFNFQRKYVKESGDEYHVIDRSSDDDF